MNPFVVFLIAVSVMVCAWLIARSMDGDRIAGYLRQRGFELLARKWQPFGRGWLGSQHERIYAVRYRDRDGAIYAATVKTSMLAGVYLTEEKLVTPGRRSEAQPLDAAELLRENERLRAENAKLAAELEHLRRPRG